MAPASGTAHGVAFLALFGLCWTASGVLAYKMNQSWSILFFTAGALVFALASVSV